MAERKGAGGRPSSYRAEYAEQAEKLCKLGATDKEMADFFGVDERTINRWKVDHPEFCQSIKAGKEIADMEVAHKLFERATGAEWTEEQAIKIKVAQFEERVEVVEVRRAAPPDTTAAIFWLKNRQPAKWRDKQEVEVSGSLTLAERVAAARKRVKDGGGSGS
jgi:hypothetical protein